MTEQEIRRAAFRKKAEIGKSRNDTLQADCVAFAEKLQKREITLAEALGCCWIAGCEYGKDHAEELKVFDN